MTGLGDWCVQVPSQVVPSDHGFSTETLGSDRVRWVFDEETRQPQYWEVTLAT